MNAQHSVLIVDESEENCEVLRTALERRGVRTLEACRPSAAVELARQFQPDLIVLDAETCGEDDLTAWPETPRMILLGNLRGWRRGASPGEIVAKPYHYGPLLRRIEELLCRREPGPCQRCSSFAEPIREAVSS